MTRRSRALRPAALRAGPEGAGEDPGVSVDAADGAALNAPAPHWPSSVLFRWEEKAGPRDAWDALPFPPLGAGVCDRLRAAALRSLLFSGRGVEGRTSTLRLSAALSVGGAPQLLPLNDDGNVEKAVKLLWTLCPATASVFAVAVREEGGGPIASAAALRGDGAAGPFEPPLPLPLRHGGGGSQPPRPAPAAALGNALPVEMWAGVMKAVASSR